MMKRRDFLLSTTAFTILNRPASAQAKYRVGILGTDNSHSGAFAKLINVDKKIPNTEVVAMYGHDADRTKEMAAAGNVKTIVDSPEKMFDLANVVFVVFRHGDLHADYAVPFIEKGIPTFVDKPFALKTDDVFKMLDASGLHKTFLSSFSTVRWGKEVVDFKNSLNEIEPVIGGGSAGPGSADSEYGGFGFYGIHAIELLTHTLTTGDKALWVSAVRDGNRIAGTLLTESHRAFSIQVADGISGFRLNAVGAKESRSVSTGGSYEEGLKVFFNGLEKKELPLSHETLFEQVAIIEAMEQSMKEDGKLTELRCMC